MVMDSIGAKRLTRSSKVKITSLGFDELNSGELDGSSSQDFLMYLNDNGESRVFEVANYCNFSDGQAVSIANQLYRKGMIIEDVEERVSEESDEGIGDLE